MRSADREIERLKLRIRELELELELSKIRDVQPALHISPYIPADPTPWRTPEEPPWCSPFWYGPKCTFFSSGDML